jgi:hypothetical protein
MTDEQINGAIAEACGWKIDKRGLGWLSPKGCYAEPPDYCTDLNAMHEAEKVIAPKNWNNHSTKWWNYCKHLQGDDINQSVHATARERAEAFLRTLGKWEDKE